MPIHINLLAEAQAAEELRRQDPVKRAIYHRRVAGRRVPDVERHGGGQRLSWRANVLPGCKWTINAKTNAYQRVVSDQKKVDAIQAKLTALQKLQAARFLQGNLLNALQHATVNDVQLTGCAWNKPAF